MSPNASIHTAILDGWNGDEFDIRFKNLMLSGIEIHCPNIKLHSPQKAKEAAVQKERDEAELKAKEITTQKELEGKQKTSLKGYEGILKIFIIYFLSALLLRIVCHVLIEFHYNIIPVRFAMQIYNIIFCSVVGRKN